jgi:hypothetical protein
MWFVWLIWERGGEGEGHRELLGSDSVVDLWFGECEWKGEMSIELGVRKWGDTEDEG